SAAPAWEQDDALGPTATLRSGLCKAVAMTNGTLPMIERAPFGRTGHESTRVIFGAAALARMSQERADQLLPVLLEFGVNHLDTAAGYGDAELRMAPWLASHRNEFFLATTTGDRPGH